MAKRLRVWMAMTVVVNGVVLGVSGRWNDPWLWTYCAIWTATISYGLLGISDDLAQERFTPPVKGADARRASRGPDRGPGPPADRGA